MDEQNISLYYWQFIHFLVVKERMRVFQVSANEKEIWVEKENAPHPTVIRVKWVNDSWLNEHLPKDLEKITKIERKIRTQLGARQIKLFNIYLTNENDREHNISELQTKRMLVETHVITNKNINEVYSLMERINVSLPPFMIQDHPEYFIEQIRTEIVTISDARQKKEKALFTYGKPMFTYVLLAIIAIVFGLMEYYGSSMSLLTLVDFGAKYDPNIHNGQWWRFFTSIFLHIGFVHFLMNSFALYYLGSAVERIYGTMRFLLIFFISGLLGSASSFAFNSQISAGASGAIFGCFGALLFFGVVHRKLFFRTMGMNIIVILVINLALGFAIPMIDNSAHVGGLIGGFLTSAFLHLPKHKRLGYQFASVVVLFLTLGGVLTYGYTADEDLENIHYINVRIGQELIEKGDVDRAYPLLKEAVDDQVNIVEANFLLAYVQAKMGLLEEAQENLLITIDEKPMFHEAHFNLSLVYFELRQFPEALSAVNTAIELNPDDHSYQELRRTIERRIRNNNYSNF